MTPPQPVEVIQTPDAVLVRYARDSTSPVLRFTHAEWAGFIASLQHAPVLEWSTPQWAMFATRLTGAQAARRLPPPFIDEPLVLSPRPPTRAGGR